MILRTILIVAVLAQHALAQSAGAPESSPIEVRGLVSSIDPHEWAGFKAGPGLFMDVRNISGRNILGFAFETTFNNPESGRVMAVREHGAFHLPQGGFRCHPVRTSRILSRINFRLLHRERPPGILLLWTW
jgi:hypothetical protein